ncbi:hypothetical protein Tco_0887636, partial [Tanacetum coccineum]
GLGYNEVPPPYTGNFMPPTPDLSFTSLDEFANKPVVENIKSDKEVSKQSVEREGSTTGGGEERGEGGDVVCGWARVVMSSASSAVTYTSVYTDSEPGRVFWGADEEISDGGYPRVIVYGYDGLPMQPVAPPSPDYIPGPEDPQTPPVPQNEDEREAMFIQPHDPDYVPQPIYPEYIPLEDEHVFPVGEQPLPPVDSPTAESPEYVTESDPKEDPEEYEDDET